MLTTAAVDYNERVVVSTGGVDTAGAFILFGSQQTQHLVLHCFIWLSGYI